MSNSNNDSRRRGLEMERRAADWLASHGLRLVDANQHARRGEIDLIMRDGDTLVFIEVRHRRDARHGHPFETVTAAKQRRLYMMQETARQQRGRGGPGYGRGYGPRPSYGRPGYGPRPYYGRPGYGPPPGYGYRRYDRY